MKVKTSGWKLNTNSLSPPLYNRVNFTVFTKGWEGKKVSLTVSKLAFLFLLDTVTKCIFIISDFKLTDKPNQLNGSGEHT